MPSRHVWAQRVAAWKSSGLTASQFAARHRFDPRSLLHWSSALRRSPSQASAVRFAPLVASSPSPAAAPIEILLASGQAIRVRSGFDPALLRAIVEALEAR